MDFDDTYRGKGGLTLRLHGHVGTRARRRLGTAANVAIKPEGKDEAINLTSLPRRRSLGENIN